ncbi:hypothetical protein FLONG3_9905 [Fusarium longipes]|uniref:Uncharacterized protein n=1 Tax=Fusarium longipes TaxID=694270 RepID=A0A395RTJ3_9HYPO|nr:hypothetical protein FLONG3_9905 [Fusarium longipes]
MNDPPDDIPRGGSLDRPILVPEDGRRTRSPARGHRNDHYTRQRDDHRRVPPANRQLPPRATTSTAASASPGPLPPGWPHGAAERLAAHYNPQLGGVPDLLSTPPPGGPARSVIHSTPPPPDRSPTAPGGAVPQPGRERLTPEVLNRMERDNVIDRRLPGVAVFYEQDLTLPEKQELRSLVEQAIRDMNPPNTPQEHRYFAATANDWKKFIEQVFDRWGSHMDAIEEPILDKPKLRETHTEVGTLVCDAPFTNAQKKKGTTMQQRERRAGAPVFVHLTLDYPEESVEFTWKDSTGTQVSNNIVRISPDLDKTTVRAKAMSHHDSRERERVSSHNLQVAVACAQRSIKVWAREGSEALYPLDRRPRFEQCLLAEHIGQNAYCTWEATRELIRRTQERVDRYGPMGFNA